MLQIGILLHKAKSGLLIVRLKKEVRPGAFLFDEQGKRLGKVVELIGPVRAPYASVVPATSRAGKSGDAVFVER